MSARKHQAVVYWLIPAQPYRELFCEIVWILARQMHAPGFEPHLTLFATAQNRQSPQKMLRALKASRIRLRIREISSSRKFTKTLFVRFESSAALRKLAVDLGRLTKSRQKALRDPHLSLLYQELSATTKRELARAIKLPFRHVVFDSIKAVRCISPTTTPEEVREWRALTRKSLR